MFVDDSPNYDTLLLDMLNDENFGIIEHKHIELDNLSKYNLNQLAAQNVRGYDDLTLSCNFCLIEGQYNTLIQMGEKTIKPLIHITKDIGQYLKIRMGALFSLRLLAAAGFVNKDLLNFTNDMFSDLSETFQIINPDIVKTSTMLLIANITKHTDAVEEQAGILVDSLDSNYFPLLISTSLALLNLQETRLRKNKSINSTLSIIESLIGVLEHNFSSKKVDIGEDKQMKLKRLLKLSKVKIKESEKKRHMSFN